MGKVNIPLRCVFGSDSGSSKRTLVPKKERGHQKIDNFSLSLSTGVFQRRAIKEGFFTTISAEIDASFSIISAWQATFFFTATPDFAASQSDFVKSEAQFRLHREGRLAEVSLLTCHEVNLNMKNSVDKVIR
ncbi:hypothetical protein LXL04_024430 [Taraxacum kok-saghyz]